MSARGSAWIAATLGLLGCVTEPPPAWNLPDEIVQFVERRRACERMRDEEPSTPERRAEIEAATEQQCRGIDRELAVLRVKYGGDATALRVLEVNENDTEAK